MLVWSITRWIYTISQGNPSILNGIHHRGSNPGVTRCCATRVYHDGVTHVYQDGVCTVYVAVPKKYMKPGILYSYLFRVSSAKFGTCTAVSVNGTLVEAKCAHSSLNLRIYLHRVSHLYSRRARAKFSTNSHEMDYSVLSWKGCWMPLAGQLLI